jgi:rod shape determining protein RodA
MGNFFKTIYRTIDWSLLACLLPIVAASLITMRSFVGETPYFERQIISIVISLVVFFCLTYLDLRFLKRTDVLVFLFLLACGLLLFVITVGYAAKGAQSWFRLGGFSFQPSDFVKLVVILLLAKYFSRRHVEIANFKHIVISALYALIPFGLVMLEPDFGSGIILFFIWFGMALVSGISKKHLLLVVGVGVVSFVLLWGFFFKPYQKARIMTFINPLSDIRGAGYNAFQSTIAVGSGQFLGKGVGYGTQSRLNYLPEYQTDFIFASFAEEWGFVGSMLIYILYGVVLWRILATALVAATNFEMLFGVGVAIFFMSHIVVNIGMNIGIMPVTGITLPFMSYGGSHLVVEFAALGIIMSTRKHSRAAHRDDMKNEFLGIA